MAKLVTWLAGSLPLPGKIFGRERIEKSPITLIGELAAALVLVIFLGIGIVTPKPVATHAEVYEVPLHVQ
jgi:hypothetical protein